MNNSIDLAIIGSGPSALTAAIYSARLGLKVTVYEKSTIGGALTQIPHIANFPGFDGKGEDLAKNLKKQAESAGAKITYGTCTSVDPLIIDDEKVSARAVLIATGSEPKTLDIDLDIPVSYCALCDGDLYKGKKIAVVGGGNSAISEALHLARIANSVDVFSHSSLKSDKTFKSELKTHSNIFVHEECEIDSKTLNEYDCAFVYIGKRPATSFLPSTLLDKDGYVITNDSYQTSIPHVFAAGDARSGSLKQAISASAEGAESAVSIANYLK